jgi:hypothetical protein
MADKSPAGYLPETSQEAIDLNQAQQEALARLNEALDVRKNRVFDPRWAAAAQGFFAPTRTGHWSEALGNVIGNVSKADEAMALEEQNIAQRKVDVATQAIALQRLKEADKSYQNDMSSQGALPAGSFRAPEHGSPTGPLIAYSSAPSGSAPEGGALPGPVAQDIPQGIQIAPAMEGLLTREQFLAKQRRENVPYEEAVLKWEDVLRKRQEIKDTGMYDTSTGRFYGRPNATPVKRQVPSSDGKPLTIEVPEGVALKMDDALSRNDIATYMKLARPYITPGLPASPAPGGIASTTPPTGGAPQAPAGGQPKFFSVEEQKRIEEQNNLKQAVAQARAIATAQEEVKQEGEDIKDIRTAGKDAIGTIAFTKTIRTLANGKQAEKIFGVLTTPNLLDNVANILDKGVMGIRVQGLEDAIRNSGLDKDGIAQARVAAGQFNQLQIRMAAAAKGAVSDYERQLFADAAINLKDPVNAVHMKNDMLEAKAVFDRNVAKAFRQSKMGVEDFRDSEAFAREYQTYIERLQGIASGQRLTETPMTAKPSAKPSAKPQQLHPSENSRRLDEALRK